MKNATGRLIGILILLLAPLLFSAARTPLRVPGHNQDGLAILVSIDQRYLWLVYGSAILMEAPVAVGTFEDFVYNGRKYSFRTPSGVRKVLKKERDPVWTVPNWHYYEKATHQKLEIVELKRGRPYLLQDSTVIVIRGNQVGRVNRFGNFWPFTPGGEIIYEGKLFVPPLGTAQREVPDALGPAKLDMGDGYLIHGTHEDNEDTIGTFASHGCVRMHNIDILRLYDLVQVGTPVYIY